MRKVRSVTRRAFVFEAGLAASPDVSRTVALADDQTLEDLNELLRAEFGWHDPSSAGEILAELEMVTCA